MYKTEGVFFLFLITQSFNLLHQFLYLDELHSFKLKATYQRLRETTQEYYERTFFQVESSSSLQSYVPHA